MDHADLIDLAARGRVKFHEPDEYILWQGEPHRHQVYVIQQGTVSLWDEAGGEAAVRRPRRRRYAGHRAIQRRRGLPPLEHSALRPLVDVGRVFAFAARRVLGTSTLERFEMVSSLLPEHQSIFRWAADTLRIVLWLQGRIGISQGTDGSELPPSLVGRHDRHLLKSGFRSIHRLLEFTADSSWLQAL